jgi:hypothetical protein
LLGKGIVRLHQDAPKSGDTQLISQNQVTHNLKNHKKIKKSGDTQLISPLLRFRTGFWVP